MSIGILDSGVGGLTVWKEINCLLPKESTLYLGDSQNCPYGTKTEEEIWRLTTALVEQALAKDVRLLVIACNTISVTVLERLRAAYPDTRFIGTIPAIKAAVAASTRKRIGVLSTPRTAESAYQKTLLETFASECLVINEGTNALVPLVERGALAAPEVDDVLKTVLRPFIEGDVDVLVLGCTHFPFLKSAIQNILGPDVLILDSGEAIARQVKRVLEEDPSYADPSGVHQFFTSGDTAQLHSLLALL